MIKLFQYDSCPYCARVTSKLQSLGLKQDVDYKLIEASRGTPGREEVLKLGGMNQVPFLVDDSVQMYESADIIDYIENKFDN